MGGAQSLAFPYDIGAVKSTDPRSLWALHAGTKKSDGSAVSIFNFDVKKNASRVTAAKNFVRRLKVLRHPYALQYIDSVELDANIYVVTEQVTPLDELLQELRSNSAALAWGLYQVTKVIEWMNKDHNLIHGNLTTASIFLNKAGDWKAQWDAIKQAGPSSVDVWLLGCLFYEVYSGSLTKPEDLKQTDRLPQSLLSLYQQVLSINAKSRALPSKMLEHKFFDTPLIGSMLFLESINIKDATEKDIFFKKLEKYVEEFPASICKYKVLPALVQALDIGSASYKAVVPVLRLGGALTQEEYAALVLPSAMKWFGAPDRAMRVTLLQNLPAILEHFPAKKVNDLFLLIENGFTDSNVGLRELTVRSMDIVAPKLDERLLNENLLKHFARLQQDVDKGVRINTTICLGRIAKHLTPASRSKVLSFAFARPLKDPEAYARTAALAAFNECAEMFSAEDAATRVLVAVAPLAYDADKGVRKAAIACLKTFTAKLEKASEERPAAPTAAGAASGSEPQRTEGGYLSWALASLPTSWAGSISSPAPKKATTMSSDTAAATPPPSMSSSSSSGALNAPAPAPVAPPANDGWETEVWEDYNVPPKSTGKASATDGWGDDDWDIEVKPTSSARESPFEAAQAKKQEKAAAVARRAGGKSE